MSARPTSPTEARLRAAKARRRKALSLEAIVDVAMSIVDADGVESVSMRRVAAEFDTGPASLYAYVANKDELLRQLLNRVTEEIELIDTDDWQEMLRAWAHDSRRIMASHNDIAVLTFGSVPVTPRLLDSLERMLSTMIAGGVPPQVATWALDIMSLYIGADVYESYLMGQRFRDDSGRGAEEIGEAYYRGIEAQFAELSHDRLPTLTTHLSLMMNGSSEDRFAFGIDMLIAGFAAQANQATQA